ncbi:hypothetical protein [Leifsonia sp. LS-T14]|uniref:hypothetical protein n=1 Tax=unclassified Leifsonia TaxID=2663824 RepID=UPI0035A6A2C6
MTYEPLPMRTVPLTRLKLDLENYRIPTRRDDEAEALAYLFESEDVIGAARLILRNGYFDNEVPIVTEDTPGTYIVQEGNRRVSALKAMQDPSIIPSHERQLHEMLKRYAEEASALPTSIRVLVAPTRDVAAPHIARLHTGESKRSWTRDQQATFYYSRLADSTVEQLRATFIGVDIPRFIRMASMRLFLTGVKFNDASLHAFAASDDLKMSAFEYAYRQKDIAAAIGIAFTKDGFPEPTEKKPADIGAGLTSGQRAAVEYLVTQFRAGKLNTRSPEFKRGSDENEDLLAKLLGTSPGGSGGSPAAPGPSAPPAPPTPPSPVPTGGAPANPGGGNPGSGPAPVPPAPRGPNHPNTRDFLDLSGMDYTANVPVNLQTRYHELRKLSLSTFPAATAILLRSLLETTIKTHFQGSPTPVSGELNVVFRQVVSSYSSEKALRHFINEINSGGTSKPGSIQWFNVAAHSVDIVITPEALREAWQRVSPLLRFLLVPPTI